MFKFLTNFKSKVILPPILLRFTFIFLFVALARDLHSLIATPASNIFGHSKGGSCIVCLNLCFKFVILKKYIYEKIITSKKKQQKKRLIHMIASQPITFNYVPNILISLKCKHYVSLDVKLSEKWMVCDVAEKKTKDIDLKLKFLSIIHFFAKKKHLWHQKKHK